MALLRATGCPVLRRPHQNLVTFADLFCSAAIYLANGPANGLSGARREAGSGLRARRELSHELEKVRRSSRPRILDARNAPRICARMLCYAAGVDIRGGDGRMRCSSKKSEK